MSASAEAKPYAEGGSAGLVRVGARTAFVIETPVGTITAEERADIVNRRVERVLGDPDLDPAEIVVRPLDDGSLAVMLGEFGLVGVTAADAEAMGIPAAALAREWAQALRAEITQLKPLYARQGAVSIKTLSEHHILLLILQVAILLIVARACGEIMARLGQPPVIGQLLAGILLGRSVLGSLAPELRTLVFPVEATQSYLLEVVSWLGVIFLLMLTGMETDIALIRRQGRPALWTAVTGIVAPFLLGMGTGYVLPERLLVTPEQRLILAIFLGTALSVSSVPVIAKILMDMRLIRRNVGQVILAAALAHDTIGWIILAVVAGLAASGGFSATVVAKALLGTLLFSLFAFTLGRRWAFRFLRWVNDSVHVEQSMLTAVVVLMLLSAGITQFIGVHAVLGAFLIGAVLSGSPLVGPRVIHPIEAVTLGIFAPIFFAAAGLHVDLSILRDPQLLVVTLGFTAAACAGKIAGCYAGGRWGGLGKWESLSIGVGTNARGAMGLIIGILGFSLGILTVEMFSILILMALLTTAMTPPLLDWTLRRVSPDEEEMARLAREEKQAVSTLGRMRRVLLPASGGPHAAIAAKLLGAVGRHHPLEVTAFYVKPGDNGGDADSAFASVTQGVGEAKVSLVTRSARSARASDAILAEAARGYDLLALGCGKDAAGSPDVVFGRFTDHIAREAPCPVLVVHAAEGGRDGPPRHILVPTTGVVHGTYASELAVAVARSTGARVTALHVVAQRDDVLFWLAHQREDAEQIAREVVSEVVALGSPFDVDVEALVRTAAHAAPGIVQVAQELGVDLIVLGSTARPTQRLFLGHTVAYVLRHAPCAVAMVRP